MNKLFALVAAAAGLLLACRQGGSTATGRVPPAASSADAMTTPDPAAVIEYRGQIIRLSKRYDDYDTYKNDPGNIAPDEIPRVQHLVKTAPVPERFPDRQSAMEVLFELKFPGYGAGDLASDKSDDGRTVLAESVEIPGANANRYVVYVSDAAGFQLADDVVLTEPPYVTEVKVRHDAILYLNMDGQVVASRPIRFAPPKDAAPQSAPASAHP